MPLGHIPTEDQSEVIGLFDIPIDRVERLAVTLLVSVLLVGVDLLDQPIDFLVGRGVALAAPERVPW